jgi:hypothetical protein
VAAATEELLDNLVLAADFSLDRTLEAGTYQLRI